MALVLNYTSIGTASPDSPPLVLLHGLFGSSENWVSRAKAMAAERLVISIDLRNHGASPHHDNMNYAAMTSDLSETLNASGHAEVLLLGHSMGGKVAMQFACQFPERVKKLIVVDIAPRPYASTHQQILDAMSRIDLSQLTRRSDADSTLAAAEPDPATRSFLLKNLSRSGQGYQWQLNLPALNTHYGKLLEAPTLQQPYGGETLFIKGKNSDYLQNKDSQLVHQWFPRASLKVIDGAGHWPHASKPAVFDHIVSRFLG